jgi:hypothetical protein
VQHDSSRVAKTICFLGFVSKINEDEKMKVWRHICVRRNIDSVAICMLRRAICMLHDFFGKMDISTKPF